MSRRPFQWASTVICALGALLTVVSGLSAASFGESDLQLSKQQKTALSRYFGGSAADNAVTIRLAPDGSILIVGVTRSADLPTTGGAPQPNYSGGTCGGSIVARLCFDTFAAKLSPDGADVVWATYFGGSGDDRAADSAVSNDGSLTIVGTTDSRDFPASAGAFQTTPLASGATAFALRFTADGDLVFATLLGGSAADEASGVDVDGSGAAYVVGHTQSTDFPTTPGAFQGANPSAMDRTAVFVSKLASDGGSLTYSTLLSGVLDDRAGGVAVNSQGEAFLTGSTASANFPMTQGNPFGNPGPVQRELNGTAADAFVARLSEDGSALVYSTFLGGSDSDAGLRIAVNDADAVYVIGSTSSRDFPTTPGAALPVWKRSQGFAAKLRADGAALEYATYLVGSVNGLAVAEDGSAYVAGATGPAPTPFGGPLVPGCSGSLLRRLSADGRQVLYSGFVPGLGDVALDGAGSVYSAGTDPAGTLPSTVGPGPAGQTDVYVAKVTLAEDPGISLTCVENGASFFPGEASPGQILTLFGSGLGQMQPAGLAVENGMVTTEVSDVRVLFDGTPAPLLFVWWNQINVVAPYSLEGKSSAAIQVERDGVLSDPFEVPVAAAHPGLFTRNSTGAGLGAILNADGSINTAANPAAPGTVVSFFGTGEGQTEPAGVDGLVAPESGDGLARPKLAASVKMGEEHAEVLYVGAAPGFVSGVLQVNVRIPSAAQPGPLPVRLTIGGRENRQPVFVEVE